MNETFMVEVGEQQYLLNLSEGKTSGILKNRIAESVFGRSFSQRADK